MNLNDTGYSGRIYESIQLRRHARHVLDTLDKLAGKFDFVAVTGKSGISVAFAALAMSEAGFNLVTIRKAYEDAHGSKIEGIATGGRYVIVDDCIDSGATMDRIHRELCNHCDDDAQPQLVGIVLYNDGTTTYDHDGEVVSTWPVLGAGFVPWYCPSPDPRVVPGEISQYEMA